MPHDTVLPTLRLPAGTSIVQAEPWQTHAVSVDSPAVEVMTDLARVKAATVHPATQLRQAEQAMIYLGVRMLFVVREMPAIEGLVTSTDLHGDQQMRLVHDRGLRWDELTVADVMTGLETLDAIPFEALRNATVGGTRRRPRPLRAGRAVALADRAPARAGDRRDADREHLRRDRARARLTASASSGRTPRRMAAQAAFQKT
jgi:hypothetical protein